MRADARGGIRAATSGGIRAIRAATKGGIRASFRKVRWESHCKRCGLCCYEKERRGRTVVTNFRRPCMHLDVGTRLCTVYEKRFAVCPQCRPMTLFHALFVTWLPPGCGYVQRYRRGRAVAKRQPA